MREGSSRHEGIFFGCRRCPSIVATTAPSFADDDGGGCSNATLKGRYGLATHGEFVGVYGTETPPLIQFYKSPSGNPAPTRIDQVADETFDGHGNATQLEYVFANGSGVTNELRRAGKTGAYQVKQDCAGLETPTYSNGFEIDRAFVLSNGGKTIHILTTKINSPFLRLAASAGVDCSKGCDVAVQMYADGERF
jgi:hypothetical protein